MIYVVCGVLLNVIGLIMFGIGMQTEPDPETEIIIKNNKELHQDQMLALTESTNGMLNDIIGIKTQEVESLRQQISYQANMINTLNKQIIWPTPPNFAPPNFTATITDKPITGGIVIVGGDVVTPTWTNTTP